MESFGRISLQKKFGCSNSHGLNMSRLRLILFSGFCIMLIVIAIAVQGYRFAYLRLEGLSQEDVVHKLGQPDNIQTLRKDEGHYFGPIEGVWYQAQTGERIHIWTYRSLVGRQELYFTDYDNQVKVQAFYWRINKWNPVY